MHKDAGRANCVVVQFCHAEVVDLDFLETDGQPDNGRRLPGPRQHQVAQTQPLRVRPSAAICRGAQQLLGSRQCVRIGRVIGVVAAVRVVAPPLSFWPAGRLQSSGSRGFTVPWSPHHAWQLDDAGSGMQPPTTPIGPVPHANRTSSHTQTSGSSFRTRVQTRAFTSRCCSRFLPGRADQSSQRRQPMPGKLTGQSACHTGRTGKPARSLRIIPPLGMQDSCSFSLDLQQHWQSSRIVVCRPVQSTSGATTLGCHEPGFDNTLGEREPAVACDPPRLRSVSRDVSRHVLRYISPGMRG